MAKKQRQVGATKKKEVKKVTSRSTLEDAASGEGKQVFFSADKMLEVIGKVGDDVPVQIQNLLDKIGTAKGMCYYFDVADVKFMLANTVEASE